MIVWGGIDQFDDDLDSGGRYCAIPNANSYTYGYRQPIRHPDGNSYFNANSNSHGHSYSQSNPDGNTDNNSNAE